MKELMNNILWPAIVVERYRPSSEEYVASCTLAPSPWNLVSDPICSREPLHAWTHTEGSRGVGSLPQMLPTDDLIATHGPYLVDVDDPGATLPYEVNTWLADLNDGVTLLREGLGDVFVVYGDGDRTVISYTVQPQPPGYQGMWQYGEKVTDFKPRIGDNLIPVRSTDLGQVTGVGDAPLRLGVSEGGYFQGLLDEVWVVPAARTGLLNLGADFAGTPLASAAPLTVTFTNLATPPGLASYYSWGFGDGGFASGVIDPYASALTTTHVYTAPGTYTVTLTVSGGRLTDVAVKPAYVMVDQE